MPHNGLRLRDAGADGLTLELPYGRHKGTGSIALIAGSALMAVAILLGSEVGFLFTGIFLAFGLPLALLGLWLPLNRLRARISPDGVAMERALAGLPLYRRRASRGEIEAVVRRQEMTASSGNRVTVWYGLAALTRDGRRIAMAEGLKGSRLPRELGERVAAILGVDYREPD